MLRPLLCETGLSGPEDMPPALAILAGVGAGERD
jgi:hypothetical protein